MGKRAILRKGIHKKLLIRPNLSDSPRAIQPGTKKQDNANVHELENFSKPLKRTQREQDPDDRHKRDESGVWVYVHVERLCGYCFS